MSDPVLMVDCEGVVSGEVRERFGKRTPVAGYVNGPGVWTPAEVREFASHILIDVEPGTEGVARRARCIDVERGGATMNDVDPFLAERRRLGHEDGTVYASLSTVPGILQVVNLSDVPRWWLAWWWDQGRPTEVAPLLAELERTTGVVLPAASVWGWQYASPGNGLPVGAVWDESVVFGARDWSR